ncbi:hypothetical protein GCM10017620_24850 [Brevundimonas intermedia]|uniref:DUF222 domain-containing protein n=1 Tax=Brevundimonas intermedia TaxID=74315 RepID=A0ABQ5TBJ2_9CAUL|nr:hypothetical protein [Brevundimonas intermedia]GLK49512.1 hypothetical protein GCM10017620_24850 [Brevundimonas intermedia]
MPVTQEITASANGRTLPDDAVPASTIEWGAVVADAQRAVVAAGPTGRSEQTHALEMDRLVALAAQASAPALARLIREGLDLKQKAHDLGQSHTCAADTAMALRKQDAGADMAKGAFAAEDQAEATWQEARDHLEAKALEVLDAPFDGLGDVLVRTDAYALLIGPAKNPAEDGGVDPAFEQDIECAYRSLRRAIVEIAAAHPGSAAFDKAEADYRAADQQMSDIGKQLGHRDGMVGKGVVFDPGLQDELCAQQQKAFEARDAAADAILAQRPASLPQLVLQMQIVAKELNSYDLSTHAARNRWLGLVGPTVAEMRTGEHGHEARAFALLLENGTRLAQQDLSAGWRRLMADDGGLVKMHPNARDVLALAASKGLDPDWFGGIHLVGDDNDHLPQIIFGTDEGHAIAKPGVVYDWRAVK